MTGRLTLLVAVAALCVAGYALFVSIGEDGPRESSPSTPADTAPDGSGAAGAGDGGPVASTVSTAASDAPASGVSDGEGVDASADSSPTSAELPGEPFEFGPSAGTVLQVVGVSHDDVLNLRDEPYGDVIATLANEHDAETGSWLLVVRSAASGEAVAEIDQSSGGVAALGNTRRLPTTIWHEVEAGGVRGWVSAEYAALLGNDYDMTDTVLDAVGEVLKADTLVGLAMRVADVLVGGAEEQPRVAVSSAPRVSQGDAAVALDVLGLADDSLRGYRLQVLADPPQDNLTTAAAGPYTLRALHATVICDSHRGATAEGLCQ